MKFSSIFLHAVTFLHVLRLDILRRQIEIETESKNNNFLMYGYNAGPPLAIPIYTVLPYCVIHACIILYIHYNAGAGYKEVTLKNHGNNGLAILHGNMKYTE